MYDRDKFNAGARFEPRRVAQRLQELAFLNSGAKVRFRAVGKDAGDLEEWQHYEYGGGLGAFVQEVAAGKDSLHAPIHIRETFEVRAGLAGSQGAARGVPHMVGG